MWSQVEQKWQEETGGESRWVAGTGLGKRKGGHGGESSTQWVRTSSKGELEREIKESDISTNGQSWASHEEIKRYRSNPVNSQSLGKPDGLMFHFKAVSVPNDFRYFTMVLLLINLGDTKNKKGKDHK